ncbi:MAG: hypothetical protein BWY75_02972 [bacterium ADurb.Bin425]|nr:MAG: hypothetical protein BWY75_02972 [bacterium ADurb.Bin425]
MVPHQYGRPISGNVFHSLNFHFEILFKEKAKERLPAGIGLKRKAELIGSAVAPHKIRVGPRQAGHRVFAKESLQGFFHVMRLTKSVYLRTILPKSQRKPSTPGPKETIKMKRLSK